MTLMPNKKTAKTVKKGLCSPGPSSSCMMVLEPRIMYDGAGVISLLDPGQDSIDAPDSHHDQPDNTDAPGSEANDLFMDYVPPADNQPVELVFIDPSVENGQQLASSINSDNQMIIILNPDQDAFGQISSYLSGFQDIEAIHIISHGGPASLDFSSGSIGLEYLEANQTELSSWSTSLTEDADILIYGCQVAAGEDGELFINQLSELTQADVAGSTDLTGATDQGGDWDLEQSSGEIEALVPAAITGYQGVLASTEYVDTGDDISAPQAANDVAFGDLDGDGDLDIVVGTGVNDKVYLNNGSGSFTYSQALTSNPTQQTALGDIDGDGDLDAIIATDGANNDEVWLNDGTGSFTSSYTIANTDSVGVVVADLDNDGDLDAIFISSSGNDAVYLNSGVGALIFSSNLASTTSSDIALADLNNDGFLDAVITTSSALADNTVWLNDGAGGFTSSAIGSMASSTGVALGDVDGDADIDLVFSYSDSANEMWLNNSAGSFTDSGQSLQSVVSDSQDIALADTDLDGDLDVLVGNDDVASEILTNNGSGTFTSSTTLNYVGNVSGLEMADIDGDGDTDLLIRDSGTAASVFLNDVQPTVDSLASTLAYTENYPYTQLDGSLVISDADSTNLNGATIVISSGYVNGEDILYFNDTGTITGTWVAGSGTLILSGQDTVANYQAALQAISFYNTSDDPDTGIRTVTFSLNDGGTDGPSSAMTVSVTAVNDAPVVTAGNTLDFTENQTAQLLDPTITITDPDNTTIQSATIVISTGYTEGEDLLFFTNSGGITGNWDANTGTLTLTGNASVANYTAALQSISFVSMGESPNETTRTITYTVNDGSANSSTVTSSVTVTRLNDAPVINPLASSNLDAIDEDEIDSIGTTVGNIVYGVVSDVDENPANGMAVVYLDSANGSWEFSTDQGTNWTVFGAVSDTSAILLSNGTLIRFVPNADFNGTASMGYRAWDVTSGTAGDTGVNVTINGGTTAFSSDYTIATLNVLSLNDAPVLDGTTTVDYLENSPPTPVAPFIRITEVDSLTIQSATIQMGSGYVISSDTLSFTDTGTITGSWNAVLGTLTLTGTDTVSNYQDALRSITYSYAGENFSTATIAVFITINDGADDSNQVTVTINHTDQNDAPVLDNTIEYTPDSIDEDPTENSGELVSDLIAGAITDPDSDALEGIAVIIAETTNGTWQYSLNSGGTWVDFGGLSTVSATLLDSDAMIRFQPDQDYNGSASLTYIAWDQSSGTSGDTGVSTLQNGGSSAFSSDQASITIEVMPVNDLPEILGLTTTTHYENDLSTTLAPLVTLVEADGDLLVSATITIGTGYVEGEDMLVFNGYGNIDGSWDSTNGVLTLIGSDSLANYQTALQMITYENSSDNPTVVDRTFSIMVADAASQSEAGSGTIVVISENDQPILDNSDSFSLPEIVEEDMESAGQTVSDLAGEAISDLDLEALQGIAVSGAETDNGTWQYSLDSGESWIDFSSLSESSATLLDLESMIRFIPNTDFDGTTFITFHAWDQTSGSNGLSGVDVSEPGDDSAFSTAIATASIAVTNINDAPILSSDATLTYEENDQPTPVDPAIILTEVDSTATIEYAVISFSSGYVAGEDLLSFTATETISGEWDEETGTLTLSGTDTPESYQEALRAITYENLSDNPDTSQRELVFSVYDGELTSNSATSTIEVVSLNDQPVLDTSSPGQMTTISEEDFSSSGDLISTIIGETITDADQGALQGIAVIWADDANGSWQYSMDGGENWLDFDSLSPTSSTLLATTNMIRFIPDADFNGSALIYYRAWDQTSGSDGDTGIDSQEDGNTAFSSMASTASITVENINDPSVLSGGGQQLIYLENSDPTVIDSTIAINDIDDTTIESATITFVSGYLEGEDLLSFSGSDTITASWDEATGTLTLSGTDSIANYQAAMQAVTYQNLSENPTETSKVISFTVSDGEASSNSVSNTVQVSAINDAPTIEDSSLTMTAMAEDQQDGNGQSVADLLNGFVTDYETPDQIGMAITGLDSSNGLWQYSLDNGQSWLSFGTVGQNNATLLGPDSLIRFIPQADFFGTATITFQAWDQTVGSAGDLQVNVLNNGGSTPFSESSATATLTIENVNDQAIITGGSQLSETEDDPAVVIDSTIVLSDIDNDYLQSATITITSGYQAGADLLAFIDTANISATWDQETGSLTLSGQDTLENYQAALQTITYQNLSDNPSQTKVIGFSVFDGTDHSSTIASTVSISLINDAPELDVSGPVNFTDVAADDFENSGDTVANFLQNDNIEPDGSDLQGMAVTSVDNSHGLWQYSLDSGQTWLEFAELSEQSAILLDGESMIRFVPEPSYYGYATILFRSWDQTSGQNGQTGVNVTVNGGTTSLSEDLGTGQVYVKIPPAPQFTATEVDLQGDQETTEPEPMTTYGDGATTFAFETTGSESYYFEQAIEPLTINFSRDLDETLLNEPIKAEPLTRAEHARLLEAGQDLPPAGEFTEEEPLNLEPEEQEPLPEEEEIKEELAPEPLPAVAPPPAAKDTAPALPPKDQPPGKPGGLSSQLAAEAGRNDIERQQIITVFDDVFKLLQCD